MKINNINTKITMIFVVALMMLGTSAYVGFTSSQGSDSYSVPQSVVNGIASQKESTYIVMMYDLPVIAYDGAGVSSYADYLVASHENALSSVGLSSAAKTYDYTFAVNGFAARMTAAQAGALQSKSDVYSVQAEEIVFPQTDNTGDFLGLTDRGGAYDLGVTGEGVVVGVIDTGIWPEHPSFADDGSYAAPPASFVGTGCDFGDPADPRDADFTCNNKLLAAKSYNSFSSKHPNEFTTARDSDGHGSHTASTAAGNAGVDASILGNDLGVVSGIAPRAHISVYKACWNDAGCFGSDLTAAIDDAVADGVDVINYSIGSSSYTVGADDVAFLFATVAGVYVATSNGNAGPGASTIGSPASVPWVTSVGASTQDRTFEGSVVLGDGQEFVGASLTSGAGPLTLVDAADHGNELCDPSAGFTPSVEGLVVLCKRGIYARVEKSQAVFEAGGAGTILYNSNPGQTLSTDNHWGPTVHITYDDGLLVKDYIATTGSGATATIVAGGKTASQGSVMADFSSRGPNLQSSDIIKPDLTAPGVNILAANTPYPYLGSPGEYFQSIGGTSMASPHVAGLYALLAQANPEWSPAMAKSALMTTARQDVVKEDGVTPADPFDMGAGHVDPSVARQWHHWKSSSSRSSFMNPGLVYDIDMTGTDGYFDYAGYTCGEGLGVFSPGSCAYLESIGVATDASSLNLPSIGIGELVGSETVSRTVTSVEEVRGNGHGSLTRGTWYFAKVDAPEGFTVDVSPRWMKVAPGETFTYEVTVTNDGSATIGEYSFGSLTWKSLSRDKFSVYSPIAVRAYEIDAPSEVFASGADGSTSFDVQFGFNGAYSAIVSGLAVADQQTDTVVDDPANDINVALATLVGVNFHDIYISGAQFARFSTFDAHVDGADDLDLYLWGPSGFLGSSGGGSSEEQINVANPEDGWYTVAVHAWQSDGPDTTYTLFSWGVPAAAGGSLTLVSAPASATVGTVGTVELSWTGLSSSKKYMGIVLHYSGTELKASTFVNVDTFP